MVSLSFSNIEDRPHHLKPRGVEQFQLRVDEGIEIISESPNEEGNKITCIVKKRSHFELQKASEHSEKYSVWLVRQ